jgi:hypothetical protein
MLTSNNLICITTGIPCNAISERRRANIVTNFAKHSIEVIFNEGITGKPSHVIMYTNIINMMRLYQSMEYTYAIICDDDFFIIPNFLEEINNTVKLLPDNWRCLHLCPGYLWGRQFRDMSKVSHLNPEYNMEDADVPFDKSGRFYNNCDGKKYSDRSFWLGGPIAMLINKNNCESLLHDFCAEYDARPHNNDVVLTRILSGCDYVCREPMLGYEEECGGTIFK